MKNIIVIAVALLIASPMSASAGETTTQAQIKPPDLTREYRMWSAERMIERLTNRVPFPKSHPMLNTIREIAANGDDVQWARIVDEVHSLEK